MKEGEGLQKQGESTKDKFHFLGRVAWALFRSQVNELTSNTVSALATQTSKSESNGLTERKHRWKAQTILTVDWDEDFTNKALMFVVRLGRQ